MILATNDPLAVEATAAIESGDVDGLAALLHDHPALATARIGTDDCSRTLAPRAHRLAGASPERRVDRDGARRRRSGCERALRRAHTETPLHWAASSDDIDALDALLDRGADIEAEGAVIGGGTPLLDATAFGQWHAATTVGRAGRRGEVVAGRDARAPRPRSSPSSPLGPRRAEEVTEAFWGACHGGQRATAERLLAEGADIDWVGWDDLTPLDAAARSGADDVVTWLGSLGARSATG